MTGGAVDSPAGGGGSGGQRSKEKQSILSVNVKQVGGAFVMVSYHPGEMKMHAIVEVYTPCLGVAALCCSRQVVYPPWGTCGRKYTTHTVVVRTTTCDRMYVHVTCGKPKRHSKTA